MNGAISQNVYLRLVITESLVHSWAGPLGLELG